MAKRTKAHVDPIHRTARQYLATAKWAIRQEVLDVIGSVLHLRSIGVDLDEESRIRVAAIREARIAHRQASLPGVAMLGEQMNAEDVQAAVTAARRSGPALTGAVAVIPLCGVIDQKIGSMSDISGGTSVDGFMKQFRQCVADPGIAGIVIDADTPGGNVSGVPEASAEILAARGTKPIVAVADPMIASAGYYLCCAADEVVCMPSGEVGSIGVLAVHDDFSAQNEMMGYKPTYISYGTYKTELNPDSPLSPDALAYQKQQIDAIGNEFTRFVAKARGLTVDTVRSSFGQGRMLLAKDALAAKMIDRIETLDAAIARVGRLAKAASMPKAPSAHVAAGVIPQDVSDELAPAGTPWAMPTLGDFTDHAWASLSETERQRIAGHYAWAASMPPASFGDLELPHHRASDGKVVFAGLLAAARRLASAPIPSQDRAAVKAHLRRQWLAFGGDEQELPESLQGALVEDFRVAVVDELTARDAGTPGRACDPSAQDRTTRFARIVGTLSVERLRAVEAAVADMESDAQAVGLLDALVTEQAAARADAESLELTMSLRSRA